MSSAVVAIQRDEDNLKEWCAWHSKIADHVFVLCNDCECPPDEGKVSFISFPTQQGASPQLQAYNLFAQRLLGEFDYAAFIDLDEMMVLHGKTVDEFVQSQPVALAYGLNWVFYGSREEEAFKGDTSTLAKRFCWRAKTCNKHIKPILNLSVMRQVGFIPMFVCPHFASPSLCQNMGTTNGPFMEGGCPDPSSLPYIAHYYAKTEAEFMKKIMRGRPDHPRDGAAQYWRNEKQMMAIREESDLNEVRDTELAESMSK